MPPIRNTDKDQRKVRDDAVLTKEDKIKRRDALQKEKDDKEKEHASAKKEVKRLEKLVKGYKNDSNDPEKLKEHDGYSLELSEKKVLKEKLEEELDELIEDLRLAQLPLVMMDVDSQEESSSAQQEDSSSAQQPPSGQQTDDPNALHPLPTAESSTLNPTQKSVTFQTVYGSETNPIDLEEELDLVTSEQSQPTAGIPDSDQHRKVLLWKRKSGGGRIAIVQYGPLNSAVYRREDVSQSDDLSQVHDYSDPKLRLGEQAAYEDGRKVWKVTRRNFISVQGVAFPDTATYKDLNPKRKKSQHWMHTDVFIKWKTDEGIMKSWETRTTFRRVWGKNKDDADDAIYRAAIWAEENFQEWKRGVRRAASRSPSQNPITAENNPANKKQKKKGKKGKGRSKRSRDQDEEGDSDDNDDDDDDSDNDNRDSENSDSEDSDSEDSDSEDSDDSDSEDNDDDFNRRSFDPSKYALKYGLIEWRWINKKIFRSLSEKEQKKMMKKVKEAVEKEKMWRKHQDKKSKKTKKAKTKKGRK